MKQEMITLGDGSKVQQTIFDNFPTWALYYAYYGADSAGDLTDDEIAMMDELLTEYGGIVSSEEESSFCASPFFGLACNVCTATFWKHL